MKKFCVSFLLFAFALLWCAPGYSQEHVDKNKLTGRPELTENEQPNKYIRWNRWFEKYEVKDLRTHETLESWQWDRWTERWERKE